MINKFLFGLVCCGFLLLQKGDCSSMSEELDMSSLSALLSKINSEFDKKALGEELEWNAIAENKKEEKAKSYIYSFVFNHDSYDLRCFLAKKGLSTNSIPSYDDYILAKDKTEIEKTLQEQISLLTSRLS